MYITGAFSGLENFRMSLNYEKGIQLSRNELFEIMRHDRDFLLETKKIRRTIKRRKMITHGYGSVWQADLCFMFQYASFVGFLCCIDVFSRKIFGQAIKTKTALAVRTAFESIFTEAHVYTRVLETDLGSEFFAKANKKFFASKTN